MNLPVFNILSEDVMNQLCYKLRLKEVDESGSILTVPTGEDMNNDKSLEKRLSFGRNSSTSSSSSGTFSLLNESENDTEDIFILVKGSAFVIEIADFEICEEEKKKNADLAIRRAHIKKRKHQRRQHSIMLGAKRNYCIHNNEKSGSSASAYGGEMSVIGENASQIYAEQNKIDRNVDFSEVEHGNSKENGNQCDSGGDSDSNSDSNSNSERDSDSDGNDSYGKNNHTGMKDNDSVMEQGRRLKRTASRLINLNVNMEENVNLMSGCNEHLNTQSKKSEQREENCTNNEPQAKKKYAILKALGTRGKAMIRNLVASVTRRRKFGEIFKIFNLRKERNGF